MHPIRYAFCILLLAALLSGLPGCATSAEAHIYRQGTTALSSDRLVEAAASFGSLGDYKDSPQLLQDIYLRALDLYKTGTYSQAAEVFRVLAQYQVRDARDYAAASQALACLENRDGPGARAALKDGNAVSKVLSDAIARVEKMLFPGTSIFRPEYVAPELISGELSARIQDLSEDSRQEYLYVMDRQAGDRVYRQYREYCLQAFQDTFRDESENYFSFRAEGTLCYVSNFHSVDGGIVILIPAP